MKHAPSAKGLSGAPVAVSFRGDRPGEGAGSINGYHELSDAVFLALLDEAGPRGVWGAAATLLGGCSAATLLVGGLAYQVSLLWLGAGFASLAALLAGALGLERRARRRALRALGVRLGLSDSFAAGLAADLENPVRRGDTSRREGGGGSWPEERLALLRALQHRRVQALALAPALALTSAEGLEKGSAHHAGEGGSEYPSEET